MRHALPSWIPGAVIGLLLVARPAPALCACSNGYRDPGEACDGEDVGGLTCAAIPGFASGQLRCLSDCTGYDVTGCQAGATVTASSCERAAVQAAVDGANPGDTVALPVGLCTWTEEVTITRSVTLMGAGPDATVIILNGERLMRVNVPNGHFRLTSLGITGVSTGYSMIGIDGELATVRLDHLHIKDHNSTQGRTVRVFMFGYYTTKQPALRGVVDHVTLENAHCLPFALHYGQDEAWLAPDDLGSFNALYYEDNSFSWASHCSGISRAVLNDAEHGARFVIRKNSIMNGQVLWHDTGSTPGARSARSLEIHDNVFQCAQRDCGWAPIGFRGGTGVVYGNTIPILPNGFAHASASEIYRVSYPAGGSPWKFACDNVVDRICSSFLSHCKGGDHRSCGGDYDCPNIGPCVDLCTQDSDCPAGSTCLQTFDGHQDEYGWPCRDQTGRGQDDPVTHEQASSPVYWWNNRDLAQHPLVLYVAPANTNYIKPNRDYFEEAEDFDGTSGVGVGTLASRPAQCTHGTGYWATDESRLYTCKDTNHWELHYVPFVYPHPLTRIGFTPTGADASVWPVPGSSSPDAGNKDGCACQVQGPVSMGSGVVGLFMVCVVFRRRGC